MSSLFDIFCKEIVVVASQCVQLVEFPIWRNSPAKQMGHGSEDVESDIPLIAKYNISSSSKAKTCAYCSLAMRSSSSRMCSAYKTSGSVRNSVIAYFNILALRLFTSNSNLARFGGFMLLLFFACVFTTH